MDRDWPLGSVAVAVFLAMVAGLLGTVLRWRTPFTAWLVIAVFALALLALQALAAAAAAAWRRAWQPAASAAALGALFVVVALLLPSLGRRAPPEGANPFGDVLAQRSRGPAK